MPIAWHPKRWWNVCMSKDEKKEIDWIVEGKSESVKMFVKVFVGSI